MTNRHRQVGAEIKDCGFVPVGRALNGASGYGGRLG